MKSVEKVKKATLVKGKSTLYARFFLRFVYTNIKNKNKKYFFLFSFPCISTGHESTS